MPENPRKAAGAAAGRRPDPDGGLRHLLRRRVPRPDAAADAGRARRHRRAGAAARRAGGQAARRARGVDREAALQLLDDREIYGAYDASANRLYVASAANRAAATALELTVNRVLAAQERPAAQVQDVKPLAASDPNGTSLFYVVIAWVFGGYFAAVLLGMVAGNRSSLAQPGGAARRRARRVRRGRQPAHAARRAARLRRARRPVPRAVGGGRADRVRHRGGVQRAAGAGRDGRHRAS